MTQRQFDDTAHDDVVSLGPDDGDALDAVLMQCSGEQPGAAEQADGRRTDEVRKLLSLLDGYRSHEPPVDLANRTIAKVAESRQRSRFAQQIADLSGPALTFGWYEIAAVAASLLIMTSLALPMLGHYRGNARQVACATNVRAIGASMGAYAADHQGTLPRGKVGSSRVWYQVGRSPGPDGSLRSNSSHLYIVIRRRYADPTTLSCPANPLAPRRFSLNAYDWPSHDAVSYSYQNQLTPTPLRVNQWPRMAILADKNPTFEIRTGQPLKMRSDVSANSLMHRTGQNVLFTDGAVGWADRPQTPDGDKLWAIGDQQQYRGDEAPTEPDDTHLVP